MTAVEGIPDGLEPRGEQLVISWGDELTAALALHRCESSPTGWVCSCGAGREWPPAPIGRARAAARLHRRGVVRRHRIAAGR